MEATKAYQSNSLDYQQEELIVQHIEFVRHILGKIIPTLPAGVDLENLESAGILGLVESAQQFDHARGIPFKGFAYRRIRGAIIDELRRNCPLPQRVLDQVKLVRAAYEVLEPPVSSDALAKETGLTVDEVESCLEAMRLTRPGIWDDASLVGQARAKEDSPDSNLLYKEQLDVVADCIEKLPERERIVLTLYYLEDLRLHEIGKVLGLSESRVSRLLAKSQLNLGELVKAKLQ